MYQTQFYESIKQELKERWYKDDITNKSIREIKANNNMRGNQIGMNPQNFGFMVWDWEDTFKKAINRQKSKYQRSLFEEDYLKGNIWDKDNKKFFGIPFQYIEQVPVWNKGANWNEMSDIMGNFESQSIYANSGAQDLSLSLVYHAESSQGSALEVSNTNFSDLKYDWNLPNIDRFILQLKSLVFPQYDGKFSPPVKMLLNIGSIYIDVPVVIKNITVEETAPYEL